MNFSDQVAIITGSSAGIGEAAAIGIAEGGGKAVINYSKSADAAEKLWPLAKPPVAMPLPCRPMSPTMRIAKHWSRPPWINGVASIFW